MESGERKPAIQVIVLGSGGGPHENNTTAFLVRSVGSGWSKGSLVAVDAGVHLSAITNILESTSPAGLGTGVPLPHVLTSGPFAGLSLPHATASANAAHVTCNLVDVYLITHPHLDHISGFVINTAALGGMRPKRLAGLPSTIAAFKAHIFNNVIWPNLSDENNGAGLVTYMRLVEGGSPALGDGEGKGYLEINDGLAVKVWGVSHGHCMEKHSHRGSASSIGTRLGSFDVASSMMSAAAHPMAQRTGSFHYEHLLHPPGTPGSMLSRAQSMLSQYPATTVPPAVESERMCVYDSSAYFIHDIATTREVLIFGDVEPDSISLSPRNRQVWQEAAPKIAAGNLTAILIECSYDNSQSVDRLFGHLKPEYIIEELQVLALEVEAARRVMATKKRKRESVRGADDGDPVLRRRPTASTIKTVSTGGNSNHAAAYSCDDAISPTVSPTSARPQRGLLAPEDFAASAPLPSPHLSAPTAELSLREAEQPTRFASPPLRGLKVVLIHVKDKLWDGEDVGEIIVDELREEEAEVGLGCEFVLSKPGQSIYL